MPNKSDLMTKKTLFFQIEFLKILEIELINYYFANYFIDIITDFYKINPFRKI
jgi:hypothetical protein